MKKHVFGSWSRPMPDVAPNWLGYACNFCGHVSGLDGWQLRDMPTSMAACPASTVRAGWWERLTGSVNCLPAVDKHSDNVVRRSDRRNDA
jgi:hypothetical protein